MDNFCIIKLQIKLNTIDYRLVITKVFTDRDLFHTWCCVSSALSAAQYCSVPVSTTEPLSVPVAAAAHFGHNDQYRLNELAGSKD